MEKQAASGDYDSLRADAHKIKGSCANMYIKKVSQKAGELEKAAVDRADTINTLLDELKAVFFEFKNYCEKESFFTG